MLKRILAVNMNYLGDALMTTPALAMLHQAYGMPVDVIAGSASGYAALEILRGNPDIGRLIGRADGGAFARCRQLVSEVRRGRYDLVVILPSIPVYRWSALLGGAKQVVFVPPKPESAHMAEHMLLSVAAQLGISPGPLKMTLPISDSARLAAGNLLAELPGGVELVGLNIGATRPQKRWPAAAFAALANRLSARGYSVVLLGSTGDKPIAAQILSEAKALNLTGRTSIPELAAVIERCAAEVTGDSGAMHIAAALEVPVVALFGSTDPAQTGPIGPGKTHVIYKHLHCAPCKSHPTCGGSFDCMTSIAPLEVLGAVEQIVGQALERPQLKIVTS